MSIQEKLDLSDEQFSVVTIHGDVEKYGEEVAGTRRPLALIRGKAITHDQVVELISNEEPLFHGWNGENGCEYYDSRGDRGVLKNIFYRQGYFWLSTWLLSDGTIGGDLMEFKYPELDEWVPKWVECTIRTPFLDMVVAYTTIDETPCYFCEILKDEYSDYYEEVSCCTDEDKCYCNKIKPYLRGYNEKISSVDEVYERSYLDLYRNSHRPKSLAGAVQITLWIHEGKVDIFAGDEAITKYKEYDELYNFEGSDVVFSGEIYHEGITAVCDESLIKECFKKVGLSDSEYDTAVCKGFFKPPKPSDFIITKEWIMSEHKKLMSKLGFNKK